MDQALLPSRLALALAAALAAAIVGAVIWGWTVLWTDYEIGVGAWVVGLLAGTAARVGAGRPALVVQAIAVGAAAVGILFGKYLAYALVVQDELKKLGSDASLFERAMLDAFRADIEHVFGLWDLVWVGVAVYTAWRIPRAEVRETPPDPA